MKSSLMVVVAAMLTASMSTSLLWFVGTATCVEFPVRTSPHTTSGTIAGGAGTIAGICGGSLRLS